MEKQKITLEECMQIHEMINFKTVCMTNSKMMEGLVFDQDLKALLEKDVQQSIPAVSSLQKLLYEVPGVKQEELIR